MWARKTDPEQTVLRGERVVGHDQAAHPQDCSARGSVQALSDAKIVLLLQDGGMFLARRTIAKYREECRIPASSRCTVSA